jgi:DNA-binding response OmpR family regulator
MAKILVVEDDDSTQGLLKLIISGAGHDVDVAGDGQTALKEILNKQPDLVVLDVMLPEVHGYSVCHQIKNNEVLRSIKVLMLSAKSFPADRRQAEEVGADAFLSKPVNPSELVEKINALLAHNGS